ncbi:MAG TPA: type II toxin-antitoxin system PemK/MazF family toxin [Patescibacteria group bacterium]|nr:type II toxin-antitoxin system PemK/MazF family toxin [Patescibacteria group bacterium]
MAEPSRGEVWLVDLSPSRGHEQAGVRPGLVVSVDPFNHGPAGLVVLLPLTTVARGIPFHVEIHPPEGGVKARSFIKCEDIRSVAKERLSRPWGKISGSTWAAVEDRLRILLGL